MNNLASQRLYWTYAEIEFLKENYKAHGAVWCGVKLGRTANAVKIEAGKLGLQSYTHYTDFEDDMLSELWNSNTSTREIADRLGRSETSIRSRKLRLGLKNRRGGRKKQHR